MPKRIYVGNLPFSASDDEVRDLASRHGKVLSVRLESSRGGKQATIEFASDLDAAKALSGLGRASLGGKLLNVSEARPRQD